MANQQPSWMLPVRQAEESVLKLYNSLTRSKTEFIPRNGKHVKWYNCGPTVYDASHMGHARNYVTQDILRRIMTDYFGYDVHFVMNITDIDNKIIDRARQNFLVEKFRTETNEASLELITTIRDAWRTYVRDKISEGKGLPDGVKPVAGQEEKSWPGLAELFQNNNWKQECLKREEKFEMYFSAAHRTLTAIHTTEALIRAGQTGQHIAHQLVDDSRDILAPALDEKFKSTVDPFIFRSLAAYWEDQFFKDMARLRVRRPDTLTRVTEYVPEIVSFVEQIIKNGYAYESAGSIYFDTMAFDKADGHHYAKLEPWSKFNRDNEEGPASVKDGLRSGYDFALWKASKEGEPFWPSPWGPGRPGWHIECSVMASAILGDNMDIHSGGSDLAFPHHDNEMAQSEAYHNCGSWVNYFLHTGHLHIDGLKMSKSLKNFITIDEILQKYTARQLRIAFLAQLWNAKVDFSESSMSGEVRSIETTFNNFFTTVKALVGQVETALTQSDGQHHYSTPEHELTQIFHQTQSSFRACLCDSFNTPEALIHLRDLVSRTNIYINSQGKKLNIVLVENVARWVGMMLRMFGLGEGEKAEIGWGQVGTGEDNVNREEVLMPYLRALSSFRDGVRRLAMAKGDDALKDILTLCDDLRDTDLVPLGVALDDQPDGKALVKLMPPSDLMKARDEKRAIADTKAAKKAAAAEADRLRRQQRLEKGRLPPEEMFKPPNVPQSAYSKWDETGIPLLDGEGKELSKSGAKKLVKDWAAQNKLHEEFLSWQRGGQ